MAWLIPFLFFLGGLIASALEAGFVRPLAGAVGYVSVISLSLTVLFFLRQARGAVYFSAGLAVGLALLSGYGFFAWIFIVAAVAVAEYFFSNSILTDQSLFALVALNLFAHTVLFISELIFSNVFGYGSPIRLRLDWPLAVAGAKAIILETITLYVFFLIYRRARGRRAGRLAHIA